jgi:hypothetical protein
VRSQDFRDEKAWKEISLGDTVSFTVELGSRGGVIGQDIVLEARYWKPSPVTQPA